MSLLKKLGDYIDKIFESPEYRRQMDRIATLKERVERCRLSSDSVPIDSEKIPSSLLEKNIQNNSVTS